MNVLSVTNEEEKKEMHKSFNKIIDIFHQLVSEDASNEDFLIAINKILATDLDGAKLTADSDGVRLVFNKRQRKNDEPTVPHKRLKTTRATNANRNVIQTYLEKISMITGLSYKLLRNGKIVTQ